MKTRTIGAAACLLAITACAAGAIGLAEQPDSQQVVPEYIMSSTAPSRQMSKGPSVPFIKANAVVHVGEDIPAGTYRTREQIGKYCYWEKAKTPDGDVYDIIANDNPPGGRPQVTLLKGQWFKTSNCETWYKEGK